MHFIIKYQSYSIESFLEQSWEQAWIIEIQDFLKAWYNSASIISVKTSGSTGTPKTIDLKKEDITTSAKITNTYFNLQHTHRALLCLPAKYIAGKLMIIRAIVADMDLICIPPQARLDLPSDLQIDFAAMTPMQVDYLITEKTNALNRINQLIIGGGATSAPLQEKLQHLSTICFQTYGMTETITHIALQQLNGAGRQQAYSVLPGCSISTDTRGCLVISADHIHEGTVVTNDLVQLIDNRQFRWLGRLDNVINSGGVKVIPEDVETQIKHLIDRPFFIFGIPDDHLGNKVAIAIERDDLDQGQQSILLNQIHSQLENPQKPRSIHFLECFIYTETGKIKRKETLKQYKIVDA